jgi:hypothetical protein
MRNSYKDVYVPYVPSGLSSAYSINAGTKESICLDCDLPAKQCKPLKCKRYKEKLKELIGNEKD